MRFGLIGYGAWGRCHARCIAELPGLELAGIACRSAATADAARRDHPAANVTTRWQDIVEDASIDIVSVVVPNHLHARIGCAALEAGKHVLLEKPMATTAEDCDRLIRAARANGRVLSIGHELRQSAQWGRVKQLVDADAIGAPLFINVNLFRNFYRTGADGWRYDPARVGSWMLEEAVHYFDLALWYFERLGDPVSIRACGNRRPGRGEGMYDNVSALLRFSGDAYATITQCTAGFEHHQVVEITGVEGAIRSAWSGAMDRDHRAVYELRVQPKGFAFERGVHESRHETITESGEVFELRQQIARTAEAIRERRPLVSGEEARKRVILCLEAERSIREGREIALSLAEP